MATKTTERRLTEAELNAPDLDDEGNFDVEYFPVPGSEGIEDPELKEAWEEAMRILDEEGDLAEEAGEGGEEDLSEVFAEDVSSFAARSNGESWQTSGRWYKREGGKTKRIPNPSGGKAPAPATAKETKDPKAKTKPPPPASPPPSKTESRQSSHEAISSALADPSTVTAESFAGLADHVKKLTVPQIKELARGIKAKLSGKKAELVQRILDHVKSKGAEGKPAAPEPPQSPAPTPSTTLPPVAPTPAPPPAAPPAPAPATTSITSFNPSTLKPGQSQLYADAKSGAYLNKNRDGSLETPLPDEKQRQEIVKILAPAIKAAWPEIMLDVTSEGFAPVSQTFGYILQNSPPGTSLNDVQAAVYQLAKDRQIQLSALNEVQKLGDDRAKAENAIFKGDRCLAYIQGSRSGNYPLDLKEKEL